jgi:AraC-like DNA-binding protein
MLLGVVYQPVLVWTLNSGRQLLAFQTRLATETLLPLSRVSEFIHVAAACELLGVSPEAVCRRLGQPFWHDCDPDGYAPVEHLRRLIDGAAHAGGSRLFGFSIGEILPIERLGVVGQVIARSANLYQALKIATRLMQGHSNLTRYWLVERDDAVWLCRGSAQFLDTGEDLTIQYALSGMIQVVQCAAGKAWWPKQIVLQGTRTIALPPIEAPGQVIVQYHPHFTAIAVPRDLLPRPIHALDADPPTLVTAAFDESAFLQTSPANGLVAALKQLIATMMPNGCPSIETAAEIARTHPRTLQRSLRRQSTSYRQLVDEVRAEKATVLLQADDASVTDVAFDLGYTDVSHFIRAFRRWSGVSPSRYRRLRLAG